MKKLIPICFMFSLMFVCPAFAQEVTPEKVDVLGWIIKALAASGAAAWIASVLTNKRGENRALDFILDVVELIAGNINKATNDKTK